MEIGVKAFRSFLGAVLLVMVTTGGTAGQGGSSNLSISQGLEKGLIRTVVAFGDSVVCGNGDFDAWPDILGRDLARSYPWVRVINAGRCGDTSVSAGERLERSVLAWRPDLVLVSLGLNDMKRHYPPARFRDNIMSLAERIETSGARVVLLTTTRLRKGTLPGPVLEAYNEGIRSVARERGVTLIDAYQKVPELEQTEYLADLVHPNRKGQQLLATVIGRGLLR